MPLCNYLLFECRDVICMINKRILSLSFLALLCLLVACSALAASVTCPSSCSCLLPDEAKKLGSHGYCNGKQAVCGYDTQKNEMYCYEKPGASTTMPQLISTAKPFVTTTPATIPPQKCSSGCTCLSSAEGKGKGLPYCGGKQTLCGYDVKTPLYCFAQTAAATTAQITVTGLRVITTTTALPVAQAKTDPCPAGCSCLAADKADTFGLKKCSGSSAACDYDPLGRPMYCYVADPVTVMSPVMVKKDTPVTTVSPPIKIIPPMVRIDTTPVPTTPAPEGGILSFIGIIFSTLFGGSKPSLQSSDNTQLTMDLCRNRYGLDSCDGTCVDLQTDEFNCGTCRDYCNADWGETCCGGACVRLPQDPGNCGSCGNVCPAGQRCNNGTCTAGACSAGLSDCGDLSCTDTSSDPDNCGSCGHACPATDDCFHGTCRTCPAGSERCNDRCTSTVSNPHACGGCGNVCAPNELCENGRCISCPSGQTRCVWMGSTSCTDLANNTSHCGTCGNQCSSNQTCCDGRCTDILSDVRNCGSCGSVCPGGDTCNDGRCSGTPLDADYCRERFGLGFCHFQCMNYTMDNNNCGCCNCRCPVGKPYCVQGECSDDLPAYCLGQGLTACYAESGTAYCTDLSTSENNCGSCGTSCPSSAICDNGVCRGRTAYCREQSALTPDFCQGNCYGSDCTGICTNLSTDERHCGACSNHCGSYEDCLSGTCYEGVWGFGCLESDQCDGRCTDFMSDDYNCRMCGARCPDRYHCINGTCTDDWHLDSYGRDCNVGSGSCPTATLLCDGRWVDRFHDSDNCEACGRVCGSEMSCCPAWTTEYPPTKYGDCVYLDWDNDNCGRCGNHCLSGETCYEGECYDFTTDELNCGGKGTSTQVCEWVGSTRYCHDVNEHLCDRATEQCCDGRCVSVNDISNCGSCGNNCGSGGVCCAGMNSGYYSGSDYRYYHPYGDCIRTSDECTADCPQGQKCCDGECMDAWRECTKRTNYTDHWECIA